jgi:hypothetical protein
MGKLMEPSVFSLITSLCCFSVIGSRDAINVFIPLFFDGLEVLLSQLPSDSPSFCVRIGVFANSIAHLSFSGRSLLYDFDIFVETYFHISTTLLEFEEGLFDSAKEAKPAFFSFSMWLECHVEGASFTPEIFSALLAEFSNSFLKALPPDLLPGGGGT